MGGWVVGLNEIKATQPNLAGAWPELGKKRENNVVFSGR